MPGRDIQLVNEEIYHVFSRGVNSQKIFNCDRDYCQFMDRMRYYQNYNLQECYSHFNDLSLEIKGDILNKLSQKRDFLVDIIAYCLMPNHFHFLLKQKVENGISKYMSNLTNSYTRYYNIKHKRTGPILQGKFKAVRVESDEQICHLSRYIHLNPYSAGIIDSLKELLEYPYSSLPEYVSHQKGICEAEIVLGQFRDIVSYRKFVFDHMDFQRNLQVIKQSILES